MTDGTSLAVDVKYAEFFQVEKMVVQRATGT